jgi:hypothetical protein
VEKTILDVVSLIVSQEGIWFDGDITLREALITAYRFSPESVGYSLVIWSCNFFSLQRETRVRDKEG